MTTRTTEQIDLALTAVETELPRINAGLQTTLRQNNLVLESEIGSLKLQPAAGPRHRRLRLAALPESSVATGSPISTRGIAARCG
jgi:hypothetical protein